MAILPILATALYPLDRLLLTAGLASESGEQYAQSQRQESQRAGQRPTEQGEEGVGDMQGHEECIQNEQETGYYEQDFASF
jgi:hypothetical protein